jgi:hypothetical protein
VEEHYRVIAARSKRSIIGHSMGGMGSFNAAFRHPELYCAAASHSGGLDYQHLTDFIPNIILEAGGGDYDPGNGLFTDLFFLLAGAWSPNLSKPPFFVDFPLDAGGALVDSVYYGKWMPNGPQRLARNLLSGPDLAIYFDCGTADELLLYPFNTAFAETLTVLGVPHLFRTIPGGRHDINAGRLALSVGFADSVMQSGSAGVGDHFHLRAAGVSGLRGVPTPSRGSVTISFLLDGEGFVTLDVLDVTGRRVARLLSDELGSGAHEVTWDRRQADPAGIYFARVDIPGVGRASTRIVLAR